MHADDALDARRNQTLTWYTIAFAVWGGALAVTFAVVIDPNVPAQTLQVTVPRSVAHALIAVQLVGFVAWYALFVRLVLIAGRVRRDPQLLAAANDERTRANRARATEVAFWTLIVATAAALPLEIVLGVAVSAKTYSLVLIWLGVVTMLMTYTTLERRDAA